MWLNNKFFFKKFFLTFFYIFIIPKLVLTTPELNMPFEITYKLTQYLPF